MIIRKSQREIEKIAGAGALVAETIAHVGSLIAPGVTTAELDDAAGRFIREHRGLPTSLGYKGYPAAICISPHDVGQDALETGIEQARIGNHVEDISQAVQTVVEEAGFSVVRSLVGHGVGRHYHEDPHIPNFGQRGRGPRLSEGMTIAIEPMITTGGADIVVADDGWTITSADGSLAAHFEHTVAITGDGPRILTPRVGVAARGPVLR